MGDSSFGGPGSEETLAGDETLGGSGRPSVRDTRLRRGETIGRYVVLEQVGVGGMGVVHAAYDPELDRKVAIKVLVPREGFGAESVARQRLLREAQAMARIRHPNVVAVYDAGVHDERVFVAMEFVEGSTLTGWLDAAPRSVREIVDVFVQAGRGLAAAHDSGVVHRDFKPDNVMVGGDEPVLRAQVMDFGLARAAVSDVDDRTLSDEDDEELVPPGSQALSGTLTRMGQVVGTPRFMAPEQHLRGSVDARTDQFSFCVALWLALYGAHPFGGQTPAELAGRVIAGTLSEAPAVPGVSARLRRALHRGLASEREQRWPSMEALLDELTHDPSRARRRALWAAAAVVVVGGAVGAQQVSHARAVAACERAGASIEEIWSDEARARVRGGLIASDIARADEIYGRLEPWIDRFAEGWRTARTEVCTITEVEERWLPDRGAVAEHCLDVQRHKLSVFLELLGEAERELVYGSVPTAADMVAASALCTDERYLAMQPPAPDPAERAERRELWIDLTRAWTMMGTSRTEEAREIRDALAPRLEALGSVPLQITALRLDARLHSIDGRYDDADVSYQRAYLLALELGVVDHALEVALDLADLRGDKHKRADEGLWWLDVAGALSRRMDLEHGGPSAIHQMNMRVAFEMANGNREGALELAERAVKLGEEVFGPKHPRMASLYAKLSFVRRELGDYDVALELVRQSVSMRIAALGEDHPDVSVILSQLGETLRQMGQRDEALEVSRRSLEIAERVHRSDSPELVAPLTNRGLMLQDVGRSEEALPPIDRAIAIEEQVSGPESAVLLPILVNRGNILQTTGKLEASKQDFERALRIIDATASPDNPVRGIVLTNLGNTENLLDNAEASAERLEEALAHLERTIGPDHPNIAIVQNNLASVQVELGRNEAATTSYRRALELSEATHDADHPDLAYPLLGLAELKLDAGRPAEALALAERALAIRESGAIAPFELAFARNIVAVCLSKTAQEPDRMRELAALALPVIEGSANHDETRQAQIEELRALVSTDSLGESRRVR